MNRALLEQLNRTTVDWGVEILRVDIQSITPPEGVRRSMEEQRAAEINSRAAILEAEGQREAAIKRAEGTKFKHICQFLKSSCQQALYVWNLWCYLR